VYLCSWVECCPGKRGGIKRSGWSELCSCPRFCYCFTEDIPLSACTVVHNRLCQHLSWLSVKILESSVMVCWELLSIVVEECSSVCYFLLFCGVRYFFSIFKIFFTRRLCLPSSKHDFSHVLTTSSTCFFL